MPTETDARVSEPLDAYQAYIAKKRAAESATLEFALEARKHRPPFIAGKLALDERNLTLPQWVGRIAWGIIWLPIFVSIPLFFPPERVNVLRKDLYDHNRKGPGEGSGGPIKVTIVPP